MGPFLPKEWVGETRRVGPDRGTGLPEGTKAPLPVKGERLGGWVVVCFVFVTPGVGSLPTPRPTQAPRGRGGSVGDSGTIGTRTVNHGSHWQPETPRDRYIRHRLPPLPPGRTVVEDPGRENPPFRRQDSDPRTGQSYDYPASGSRKWRPTLDRVAPHPCGDDRRNGRIVVQRTDGGWSRTPRGREGCGDGLWGSDPGHRVYPKDSKPLTLTPRSHP